MESLIDREINNIRDWFTLERKEVLKIHAIERLAGVPKTSLYDCLTPARHRKIFPENQLIKLVKVLKIFGYEPITEKIDISYIEKIVCNYFNIKAEELKQKTRKTDILLPRQICIFFSREFKVGGNCISAKRYNINPSTCQHAIKTINNFIDTNKKFAEEIETIRKKLTI